MTKLTTTDRTLVRMLTENTGTHMLDSGGANGRAWQRNQGRDFLAEPATVLTPVGGWVDDGADYEPDVTHSVFHFLRECADVDVSLNRAYQAFAARRRRDEYELAIMELFLDHLRDRRGAEITGFQGDGTPTCVNTYNGEDLLAQILQYTYFSMNDTDYALLQIHGGADARGGYTGAVVFETGDNGRVSLWDNARASIYPVKPADFVGTGDLFGERYSQPTAWSTDNAYHWYPNGSCGQGYRQLETYTVSRDPEQAGDGEHVYVDDDGRAHCPLTGWRLEAGW